LAEQADALYDPLVGDRVDLDRRVQQSQRRVDVPQRLLAVPELAFELTISDVNCARLLRKADRA
jgi:hypothetical protein